MSSQRCAQHERWSECYERELLLLHSVMSYYQFAIKELSSIIALVNKELSLVQSWDLRPPPPDSRMILWLLTKHNDSIITLFSDINSLSYSYPLFIFSLFISLTLPPLFHIQTITYMSVAENYIFNFQYFIWIDHLEWKRKQRRN